jgi:hypothetical protein
VDPARVSRVALQAARKRNPARLVLATPVTAADTIDRLRPLADEVVSVEMPAGLGAIGFYYTEFHQMSDDEVTAINNEDAKAAPRTWRGPAVSSGWSGAIRNRTDRMRLWLGGGDSLWRRLGCCRGRRGGWGSATVGADGDASGNLFPPGIRRFSIRTASKPTAIPPAE